MNVRTKGITFLASIKIKQKKKFERGNKNMKKQESEK